MGVPQVSAARASVQRVCFRFQSEIAAAADSVVLVADAGFGGGHDSRCSVAEDRWRCYFSCAAPGFDVAEEPVELGCDWEFD